MIQAGAALAGQLRENATLRGVPPKGATSFAASAELSRDPRFTLLTAHRDALGLVARVVQAKPFANEFFRRLVGNRPPAAADSK